MANYEHPHYTQTFRPKPHGGSREIWLPDEEAKSVNRQLNGKLYHRIGMKALAEDVPYVYATGGYPGRTLGGNLLPHADDFYFFLTDLSDAYGSVDPERLAIHLVELDLFRNTPNALRFLEEYCTHPSGRGLLQGAPASPALFNLYCRELDTRLAEECDTHGIAYTRYLDDLAFSAPKDGEPIGKRKRSRLFRIIEDDGWEIASHKTRVETLSMPVTITGLSLYPNGYWKLSRELVGKIKNAFDTVQRKIYSGDQITKHDIGVLDGYHGTILGGHDPRRGQWTPLEIELIQRYQTLRLEAVPLLGASALT